MADNLAFKLTEPGEKLELASASEAGGGPGYGKITDQVQVDKSRYLFNRFSESNRFF